MLHKDIANSLTNRKAQGISLNVIIIAVIALLVLVVIVFIFTGKTRTFTQELATCESKGGTCYSSGNCDGIGPLVGIIGEDVTCAENNIQSGVCCVKLNP